MADRYRRLGLFVCWTLAASSAALAESRLVFPRLANQPSQVTGIAIVNLGTATAQVRLTAYDGEGAVLGVLTSEELSSLAIAPGTQFADIIETIFTSLPQPGPEELVGWIEAFSESDDLTGFFLYLDTPETTFFDGADLPPLSEEVVFHDVRLDGDFSTEINLVNPTASATQLRLDLFGTTSTPLASRNLTIAANGAARLDAGTFFGSAAETASVVATSLTSDSTIAGFEFVRETADLRGTNARPATESFQTLFFPQLAVRDDINTEVGVTNFSAATTTVTITPHRPDGSDYDVESGEVTVASISAELPPQASLRQDMRAFGFDTSVLNEGWISVEAETTAINGYVSYLTDTGSRATVSSVDVPRTRAIFAQLATTAEFLTGLAILNPGSTPATVQIVALRQNGEYIGEKQLVLSPGQRVADLISNSPEAPAGGLIPAAAGEAGGVISVSSDFPLYMTSLFIRTLPSGGLLYANVPPQPAPLLFKPQGAQDTLEVSPLAASVQIEGSKQFGSSSATAVTWSLQGPAEMDSGMIDPQTGLYTAPDAQPLPLPLTITADNGVSLGSAAVDILDPVELEMASLGLVQSVTYLESTRRIYTLELATLGKRGRNQRGTASSDTNLFSRPLPGSGPEPDSPALVFHNELVIKMLPFVDDDGGEWLLLLNSTLGLLQVVDPASFAVDTVADRLFNLPLAMGFESDGSLSVRDLDGTAMVDRQEILDGRPNNKAASNAAGAAPSYAFQREGLSERAERRRQPAALQARGLFPLLEAADFARDACTGDFYLTFPAGNALVRISGQTGQPTLVPVDLEGPTSLQPLYRRQVPCPQAFRLLISEPSAARIQIYSPSHGQLDVWLEGSVADTLAFVPGQTGLGKSGVVLLAQSGTTQQSGLSIGGDIPLLGQSSTTQTGALFAVDVPNLFSRFPVNPPAICQGTIPFTDINLENAAGIALNSETPIPCSLASDLKALNAPDSQIRFLNGLQYLNRLGALDLSHNAIRRIKPLSGLLLLEFVNLEGNDIVSIKPLCRLSRLNRLELGGNDVRDLTPLRTLTELRILTLEGNPLEDIAVLEFLTNLQVLNLSTTGTDDLAPLVLNPGLGAGDAIDVRDNPLNAGDCGDITALRARGATVLTDVDCGL